MSVLMRAVILNSEAAKISSERMKGLLDKKENENSKAKKMNEMLQILDDIKRPRGEQNTAVMYQSEMEDLRRMAREAGFTLTLDDFGAVRNMDAETGDGETTYAWLDSKDGEESWVKDREEMLEHLEQKITRAIETQEDESSQVSLDLNLAMNKYSQKLQDANGTASLIKDLDSALVVRG